MFGREKRFSLDEVLKRRERCVYRFSYLNVDVPLRQLLSSPSSHIPLFCLPSSTPPCLLIPLHSASFEEVRLLSAWRNKSDLWMGQPTWVLEGEASGSQALWYSSPLFPPASLQGKLLCLACLWSFTVPYWRRILPLSDSQTAQIPMYCQGAHVCKTIFSEARTSTVCSWWSIFIYMQSTTQVNACTLHRLYCYAKSDISCLLWLDVLIFLTIGEDG